MSGLAFITRFKDGYDGTGSNQCGEREKKAFEVRGF